ncbi:hypothetical protein PM082_009145 [Marasmius tenuissimus]|nr:hypothetical protein PM082_009145 [Marasmius tenuissimus]
MVNEYESELRRQRHYYCEWQIEKRHYCDVHHCRSRNLFDERRQDSARVYPHHGMADMEETLSRRRTVREPKGDEKRDGGWQCRSGIPEIE